MYIEKINVRSFGRLSDREITLSPGINVIEGPNESGKTTVASFIKFILYGMKGAESADAQRYFCWDGSAASGSLTVRADDGRRISIERRAAITGARGTVRETVRMTDLDTGLEIPCGDARCPGEALFGVPEDVFSGTAFVRQMDGAAIDGGKMSAAAENLLFSADEAINTEKAASAIDLVRRQLLYKNAKGGIIYDTESKIAALTGELEAAKRSSAELINVEAAIADYEKKRCAVSARRDDIRRRANEFETLRDLLRFDRLGELRRKMSELDAKRKALASADARFGGIPGEETAEKLRAASDGMSATSASIAALSQKLDGMKAEADKCPDRELYARLVDDENAVEEIVDGFEKADSRKIGFAAAAILMFIFTAVSAALGFTFTVLANIRAPLLAAGIVFAAAAAISAVIAIVSGSVCRRTLRRYGAADREELRPRLLDAAEAAEDYRLLDERIEDLESELYVQYSVYDEEKSDARALLERFGVGGSSDSDISAAVAELATSAETLISRDRAIAEELGALDTAAGELEHQLAGRDEDEVRAAASLLDAQSFDSSAASNLKRELELAEGANQRLTEAIHALEVKRAQLAATRTDPAAISEKLDALSRGLLLDRERYDACMLAIEALGRAGQNVRESVAPRLREMARGYMGTISGGKYSELGIDAKFGVTVSADGAYRELGLLSGGTVDAVYLSLRLALVRLLYRRELPPLVFDETFSRIDDARTRALISIIRDGGLQTLILTCQRREAEFVKGASRVALDNQKA